jgi:cyanophycinase
MMFNVYIKEELGERNMQNGELLIIGGSEKKEGNTEILDKFVELSQINAGAIGVLPTASQIPDQVSAQYVDTFQRLGADEVEILDVVSRERAESREINELVSTLSALFITGGNQKRLTDLIKGTALDSTLYQKWTEGMVIAGTSAGASIMGEEIIFSLQPEEDDDGIEVAMDQGFAYLKNTIIDQHFSQRTRLDRLLKTIAQNRETIGIGIDENTAILVKDDQFEVLGEHQVIVIDGRERTYVDTHIGKDGRTEPVMTNVQLHTLTKGYKFDLQKRRLLMGEREKR